MNRPLLLLLFLLGEAPLSAETRVTLLGPDYPPYSGNQGDQRLWCDLVDAALARQGFAVDWVFLPLARMKAEVGQGAADLRAHYLAGLAALKADGTFAQIVARYQPSKR